MKPLVAVFAKDPVAGRVKTRLAAGIGPACATELYAAMVSDLIELVMQHGDLWDIEIHLDRHSEFYHRFRCPMVLQCGEDLGEKLYASLTRSLEAGRPRVTILGSDAPGLDVDSLVRLAEGPEEIRLGPTDDGGFWGICAQQLRPAMFEGVRWSSQNALADTVAAARRAGLTVGFGPQGWDVDEVADLARLVNEGCAGRHTAGMLPRVKSWLL